MRMLFGLVVALAALASGHAVAQSWPEQTVRILVGFPAGTSPDLIARSITEPLSQALGQPVLVENKTGAAGSQGGGAGRLQPAAA